MRHFFLFALVWFGMGVLSAQNTTVQPGASIHLVGSGKLILQGNLTNNGNVQSADQSALRFAGDTRSAISGSGSTVLQDLQLAKNNESVELLQPVAVNGILEFVNDANYLFCVDDTLTLGPTIGSIVGADANNYVVTNGAGVLLKKQVAGGFFYPVGFDQSTYNPVAITNSGGAEDLGIRCREHILSHASAGAPAAQKVVDASWDLVKPQSNGANLNLDLTWNGGDELTNFNRSQCFVSQFYNGNWDIQTLSAATGIDPYTATRLGLVTAGTLGVFSATPTVANAGNDVAVCANSALLSAETPTRGTGTWSVQSGTGGTLGDIHAPNTLFSGITGQTYTLHWTVDDPLSLWMSSTDVLKVTLGTTVAAEAGGNQAICAYEMATLAASGSNVSTTWSIVGGPSASVAQFDDPTADDAVFTPAGGAGTYTLRWTVDNGPCPATTDEMQVLVKPAAAIALASAPGSDNPTVCASGSINIVYNVNSGVEMVTTAGLPNGLSGSLANGVFSITGNSTEVGTHNYLLTTVGCSPAATATGKVTILPNAPPIITCPPDVLRYVDPGTCTATVSYPDPTFSGNCFSIILSKLGGPASGATLTKGNYQAVWQAAQNGGALTSQCTINITVVDNIAPALTCPSNQSRNTDAGQCTALVSYPNPTATDNCNTPAPTVVHVSGGTGTIQGASTSSATFAKGINTVQWMATDGAGLTKTCTFRVIVNDRTPPTLTCPTPTPLNTAPGTCSATFTYTNPAFTDNCAPTSGTSIRVSGPVSGSTFPTGNTNVVFQATDASGNTSRCTMVLTVTDNQPPIVNCPAPTTVNGSGNPCIATVFFANPTATDNCAGTLTPFLVSGLASGSSFPAGVTTNTWRTIAPNGQIGECTFTVTVTCGSLRNAVKDRDTEGVFQPVPLPIFSLFPNPAAQEAWLDLSASENLPCTVRLSDIRGVLLRQYPVAETSRAGLFRLDLSGLPAGLYWVQVQQVQGKAVQVLKLVVERG